MIHLCQIERLDKSWVASRPRKCSSTPHFHTMARQRRPGHHIIHYKTITWSDIIGPRYYIQEDADGVSRLPKIRFKIREMNSATSRRLTQMNGKIMPARGQTSVRHSKSKQPLSLSPRLSCVLSSPPSTTWPEFRPPTTPRGLAWVADITRPRAPHTAWFFNGH